jgi:hypothetical protein
VYKKISFVLIVLALVAGSLACSLFTQAVDLNLEAVSGNGVGATRELEVGSFDAVRVGNQGNLYIESGERVSLRIEAEENLLDYLDTRVSGATLIFETRRNSNLRNTMPINYYLTVPNDLLNAIEVQSSGDVNGPALFADQFEIRVNSSGDVHLQGLQVERLRVTINSSGDVIINGGSVDHQTVNINSSGNYEAQGLESQAADINLTSSGDASVTVLETLQANLKSSGNLQYYGDPQTDINETSSGRAERR